MYNILCLDIVPSNKNSIFLKDLFTEDDEKYNLFVQTDLSNIYDIINNKQIELVLINTTVPNKESLSISSSIKNKEIPVIFLTDVIDTKTIKEVLENASDYLSQPFIEIEFLTKINLHLKMNTISNKLKEESLCNESIMEYSHNIFFIQNNKKIIRANKIFLNFFKIQNVDEFNAQHNCISELFMEYENFYSKHILNKDQKWLDNLSHSRLTTNYKVLIMDMETFEPRAFRIHVSVIDNNENFLVTLTDITNLTIKSKEFEMKATYDNLTRIYNRSKFNDIMESEYKKFILQNSSLCFAILDIDFFKKVNDQYGHIIGDETLITFAQTIENSLIEVDTFARWGGEEFTILLPNTKINEAYIIVDELRKIIENTLFKLIGQKTCSIGLTQFRKTDTIDDIIIRADEALYEAKESGRNKVCIK